MEATKKANKDAYERAKQAEQDALAARTALVETSMQAQTGMEATKKAKGGSEEARGRYRTKESVDSADSCESRTRRNSCYYCFASRKRAGRSRY